MEWTFGDALWGLVAFFFWFVFIWMFIGVFSDVFRRDDLSGWAKAGWILLICVLPFLGTLIYLIARPRITDQDRRLIAESEEQERRLRGYSTADEISKLTRLRDNGEISAQEYERLKARAVA